MKKPLEGFSIIEPGHSVAAPYAGLILAEFGATGPCGPDANIAKPIALEAIEMVAETALPTHGGFGFAHEYDIERKWREARLYQTAPIPTNPVLAFVARHVHGLPRSYRGRNRMLLLPYPAPRSATPRQA